MIASLATESAPAKINLALHVRRRRPDGYHDLETLFAFAVEGDLLHAKVADRLSLEIGGAFAAGLGTGEENLVMRAAITLRDRFGLEAGAAIRLEKHLPIASGIGGGSADAAAALRLLSRIWGIDPADPAVSAIAAELGADVRACLLGQPTIGLGRGDALTPFANPFAGEPLLLVNPLVAVSTGQVFANWDRVDHGALQPGRPGSWRNDLTAPAIALAPAIADVLERLAAASGATFVRMSGSGATCFAIFESEVARDAAAAAFTDCWALATRLG